MQQNNIASCLICNHQNWKKVYTIDQWDIQQCRECGFAKIDPFFMSEDRSEFYSDENASEMIKREKPPLSKFFWRLKRGFNDRVIKRDKPSIFLNKLHKYIPKQGHVLDVGCGDGGFLRSIKNDYVGQGIEIGSYWMEYCKRKDVNVQQGDFLTTDYSGQKFDAITMISVIEHIHDPEQMLKKCFDLMNKNSVLLLKTVNFDSLNRKIAREKWCGLRPPDHVVYFDPFNMNQLLRKVGFSEVKTDAGPLSDNMYFDAIK